MERGYFVVTGRRQYVSTELLGLVLWTLSILGCAHYAQGLSRHLGMTCLGAALLSQQPLADIHSLACCLLLLALHKSKHC